MDNMNLFNRTAEYLDIADVRAKVIDCVNNADDTRIVKILQAIQNTDNSNAMFDIVVYQFNEESVKAFEEAEQLDGSTGTTDLDELFKELAV